MGLILRSSPIATQEDPNAEILVLDDQGINLGRMLYRDAKSLAINRNLDLVQVNKDHDKVVVFKIMDHGKYKYEKKKHKQKKTVQPLKEMSFRLRIDPHDMEIKINRIRDFLLKGSDVKITVTMRGRERATPQLAHQKLEAILAKLAESVQTQQKRSTKSSVFATVRPLQGKSKNATAHTKSAPVRNANRSHGIQEDVEKINQKTSA